jgi:cytochrome c oxidase assembly protein subunit 15
VRGLVVAAVLLVVLQGLLGGARVLLDDKTVAKVHACTGPLFFAVAVAIAALTGRREVSAPAASPAASWTSIGLLAAAYVQLVAGAQLRHLDAATIAPATFRWLVVFHVLGAVAVTALAVAAAISCRVHASLAARRWSLAIAGFVCCQVALGVGAWFVSWGVPAGWLPAAWLPTEPLAARSTVGAVVITGHVVLGMLILGAAVALAIATGLFAGRATRVALQSRPPRNGRSERAYA